MYVVDQHRSHTQTRDTTRLIYRLKILIYYLKRDMSILSYDLKFMSFLLKFLPQNYLKLLTDLKKNTDLSSQNSDFFHGFALSLIVIHFRSIAL